jgi:hypothetical protein
VAIITEGSGELIVSHYLGAAALAAVEMGMVGEVLLKLYSLLWDTVLCVGAELLYFIDRKRTEAVFTFQLLIGGIEFQVCVTVRALVLN